MADHGGPTTRPTSGPTTYPTSGPTTYPTSGPTSYPTSGPTTPTTYPTSGGGTSGMSGPIVGHVGHVGPDRRACRARLRSGRRLSEIALLGFHRLLHWIFFLSCMEELNSSVVSIFFFVHTLISMHGGNNGHTRTCKLVVRVL